MKLDKACSNSIVAMASYVNGLGAVTFVSGDSWKATSLSMTKK
ncbi:hypothetical protein QUF65_01960 [Lysinibacillus sphaericus]|nr:hypothetical protein [Lysinibacillus sphaericus]